MRQGPSILLLLCSSLVLSHTASAADHCLIAEPGVPVFDYRRLPSGGQIRSFGSSQFALVGREYVAFLATLEGPAVTAQDDEVVMMARCDQTRQWILAREGDEAPGTEPGVVFAGFGRSGRSIWGTPEGSVMFVGSLRSRDGEPLIGGRYGLWRHQGVEVEYVARDGDGEPPIRDLFSSRIRHTARTRGTPITMFAFGGRVRLVDQSRTVQFSIGQSFMLPSTGPSTPPRACLLQSLSRNALGPDGNIAFLATSSEADGSRCPNAILRGDLSGQLVPVAAAGSPVPGYPSGLRGTPSTLYDIEAESNPDPIWLQADGSVIFPATVFLSTAEGGVYATATARSGPNLQPEVLALDAQLLGGGDRMIRFQDARVQASVTGDVLLRAALIGGIRNWALVTGAGGPVSVDQMGLPGPSSLTRLIDDGSGLDLPDGRRVIESLLTYGINPAGDVAFGALLEGSSHIYRARRGGLIERVSGRGEPLELEGRERTVIDLFGFDFAEPFGGRTVFDSRGSIAYGATLSNPRKSALLLAPAEKAPDQDGRTLVLFVNDMGYPMPLARGQAQSLADVVRTKLTVTEFAQLRFDVLHNRAYEDYNGRQSDLQQVWADHYRFAASPLTDRFDDFLRTIYGFFVTTVENPFSLAELRNPKTFLLNALYSVGTIDTFGPDPARDRPRTLEELRSRLARYRKVIIVAYAGGVPLAFGMYKALTSVEQARVHLITVANPYPSSIDGSPNISLCGDPWLDILRDEGWRPAPENVRADPLGCQTNKPNADFEEAYLGCASSRDRIILAIRRAADLVNLPEMPAKETCE